MTINNETGLLQYCLNLYKLGCIPDGYNIYIGVDAHFMDKFREHDIYITSFGTFNVKYTSKITVGDWLVLPKSIKIRT